MDMESIPTHKLHKAIPAYNKRYIPVILNIFSYESFFSRQLADVAFISKRNKNPFVNLFLKLGNFNGLAAVGN